MPENKIIFNNISYDSRMFIEQVHSLYLVSDDQNKIKLLKKYLNYLLSEDSEFFEEKNM